MKIISMNDVWKNIALSSKLANYKTEDLFDIKITWSKYDIVVSGDIISVLSDSLVDDWRTKVLIKELSKKSNNNVDQKTYKSIVLWILDNDNEAIFNSVKNWVVDSFGEAIW